MALDRFLRDIFQEEQTKVASVDLETQLGNLPTETLLKIAMGVEEKTIGPETEKVAKKKEPEYSVRPSWWAGQKASGRAARAGDKGLNKFLAEDRLIGARTRKSLKGSIVGGGIGAGLGAAVGAGLGKEVGRRHAAGLGAVIGGGLGSNTGHALGIHKADKEYLKDRGIKLRYGGLGTPHMTEDAAKKYLKNKEPRTVVKKASLEFADQMGRDLARSHTEVAKEAACAGGKIKEDAFTTPEAQSKAKVMSSALKATKGSPANVRKAAVRVAGKQLNG